MKAALLVCALVATPAWAQVYKCIEGGKAVFSDTPCLKAEGGAIDVRPATGGPVNRSAEYWAEQDRRAKIESERREAEFQREVDRRVRATPPPAKPLSPADSAQLIERAKKAVLYQLFDPDSGRFRNLSARTSEVCGEVNGKNRFGGYTGFQTFWVKFGPEPEVWMGDILGPSAQRICAARIAASAAQ